MEVKLTAKQLAEELFKIHTHAELVNDQDSGQIVYKEKDIINLLIKLGYPEPDFTNGKIIRVKI